MEYPRRPEASYSGWGRVKHTETGEVFDIFDAKYQRDEAALPRGIYEHYKSSEEVRRYYQVELVVQDSETGERFVIYEPLYESVEYRSARPLEMFLDSVEIEGKEVPRFRLVKSAGS